jgi:hypothetical protein
MVVSCLRGVQKNDHNFFDVPHSITVVPEMDFSTNDGSSSSVGKDDDEIDSAGPAPKY